METMEAIRAACVLMGMFGAPAILVLGVVEILVRIITKD